MAAALALLSSLLWGTADFAGGLLSRRLAPLVAVVVSQAIAWAGLAIAVAVTGEGSPAGVWPWAPLAGIAGTLALGCFYAALALGTMGVVSPIAATGVVVPVVVGLAAGERPAPAVLLGIAAAIIGVVLASGPEIRAVEADRGRVTALVLALLAAFGFGVTLVFLAEAASGGLLPTLFWQRSAGVGVGLLLLLLLPRLRGRPARRDLPLLVLVGAFDLAANGAYAAAATAGLLSVTAVLGSLYPVMTVLLARFLLGERLLRVQLVGVVVVLVGVVLIAAT